MIAGTVIRITVLAAAAMLLLAQDPQAAKHEQIARHRNLGKAFYENPTTQLKAVDEFRAALELAPDSARERVNYGLALLRAGKTEEGIRELEKAQKQDQKIPHTWFNLGIAYKKNGQRNAEAIAQLESMARLVPNEPATHYNLGILYKLADRQDLALKEFEESSRLDPNLAGPHYQLYNAYRQLQRNEDAAREQNTFQEIKKRTAGAAVPEDLEWSFYAEIYDPVDPGDAGVDSPNTRLTLTSTRIGGGVDAVSARLVVTDVDGDGRPDLIVWSARSVQVFRSGTTETIECGLSGLRDVLDIAPGDFNNDGLADLAVVTKSGAALYENKRGKFEPSAFKLPSGRFQRAVWLDFDHDYDLDLILLGEDAALARNNGAAGFSDETARFPFVKARALDAVVLDTVPDTPAMDLVVTYADRHGVEYADKLAGKYERRDLEAIPAGATSIAARDFNNDGWTDLAVISGKDTALLQNDAGRFSVKASLSGKGDPVFTDFGDRGIVDIATAGAIYRNRAGVRFDAEVAGPLSNVTAMASAVFDADGRQAIAAVKADGSVEVIRSAPSGSNRWLPVDLTGVKNLKLAYDAKVELKAGALYQKQTYRGVPLHFGTGTRSAIDTLRITWANGMVQNETGKTSGMPLAVKEAPRLSGSCPMIFTWNGTNFEFVTDVLGVAPLGASAGDGTYFPVDHDEYVQIPEGALAPKGGAYEVRITEELHEVSYLDQVRLIGVDHPREVEIFTNDKFKSPPFPEFRLFGARRRIYPVAAHDQQGRDVLRTLLKRDGMWPDSFARAYDGTAEIHYLDVDFGKAAQSNHATLILNGWVDWADGSTFLAAAQASKAGLVMPYLQVKDAAGRWRTVIEDMGMPSGKPKTIAVDLTGKFLSTSREVRIVTNLCVYWDEIFLSEDDAPETVVTALDPSSADLHYRGFSHPVIDNLRRQPERFEYGKVEPASQWNPTPGLYTRYGDVRGLIDRIDDRLVIMGSGDEVTLKFSGAALPALRSGWKRDFLLLVDGWAKDADPNTAYSRSVEPLPFHAMSSYPYPEGEHFPDDSAHREYRNIYNTRPALRLLRPLTD
jgi:Flp pilus assembly protein TadD